ncbi:MAG: hypothetical protein ACFFD8_08600 [Candidatus Thorarchaeota archaeon]
MVFLLLYSITLITSYATIGAGIKYLDYLSDQSNHYNQTKPNELLQWLLIASLAFLVNFWGFFDAFTALLILALLLGLCGAGKIDNVLFLVLSILSLPVALFTLFNPVFFLFLLPTLLVLIPPIILDEFLDSRASTISHSTLQWVLRHRPLLKIVVFVLPFLGLLPFTHTVAFWSFDVAYDVVAFYFRAPQS